jgi:hypothetical protein
VTRRTRVTARRASDRPWLLTAPRRTRCLAVLVLVVVVGSGCHGTSRSSESSTARTGPASSTAGGDRRAETGQKQPPAPGRFVQAPRYHDCGRVALSIAPTPVYAHKVSCAVAIAVVNGCSSSLRKGGCFGESAVPAVHYKGIRVAALPEQAPAWKPLGFACYQPLGDTQKGCRRCRPTCPIQSRSSATGKRSALGRTQSSFSRSSLTWCRPRLCQRLLARVGRAGRGGRVSRDPFCPFDPSYWLKGAKDRLRGR